VERARAAEAGRPPPHPKRGPAHTRTRAHTARRPPPQAQALFTDTSRTTQDSSTAAGARARAHTRTRPRSLQPPHQREGEKRKEPFVLPSFCSRPRVRREDRGKVFRREGQEGGRGGMKEGSTRAHTRTPRLAPRSEHEQQGCTARPPGQGGQATGRESQGGGARAPHPHPRPLSLFGGGVGGWVGGWGGLSRSGSPATRPLSRSHPGKRGGKDTLLDTYACTKRRKRKPKAGTGGRRKGSPRAGTPPSPPQLLTCPHP